MSAATTQPVRAIPARERLIFALDVPDLEGAKKLVARLADAVHFYKIGLELATSPHYFELLRWLIDQDKRVFTDLKLYDIPATVGAAVRQLRNSGASFLTVHGDRAIMEAAAAEKGANLQVLAVTVLPPRGDRHPARDERPLHHHLVHADRGAEHARADVRQVREFEQPLERAVLAVQIGRAHV